MLKAAAIILSTSYVAWYLERHELLAVYPFDETYATPESAGVPHLTEVVYPAEDGTHLISWRAKATAGYPTVLYFSGNSGTLKDRADRFKRLTDQGFGVVAPAYRGSSGSDGRPDEASLVADARAISVSLANSPLVLYGESLGAAIAIRLASEGIGDAVVLEAPFTSLAALVAARHPTENLDHLITQRWDSLQSVGQLTQPLLVIHGEEDTIVPFEMGQQIYTTAGSVRKNFLAVGMQGHSDLWTDDVRSTLFEFVRTLGN